MTKMQTPFGEMDDIEYRKMQIQFELQLIDSKTIRAIRADFIGSATEDDKIRLKDLEMQAEQLRTELRTL